MREKDLFYYKYENNEQDYDEVGNLVLEMINVQNMTDEQELFLKDFYLRLLFRMALLEASNTPIEKIEEEFDGLFDIEKIKEIKVKFSIVIDFIKDKLYKDISEEK